MAEPGQQRAFAKNIKQHSALQIRQSTVATVKAASEKERPKLNVVEPLDYEGELIARRKDLEKEQFLNLMLFPQQDVTVEDEELDHRTAIPPVTSEVVKEASSLFTHECLKLYSSKWHKVNYNFSKFSMGFSALLNPEYPKTLPEESFELDLVAQEKFNSLSADMSGGTPLNKKGYLHKGPFPQDGGVSVSMKNYRKRWFVLSGGPREGGYILTFYKDEKSNNIKGKIDLDTCTEVTKNSRYKAFGFDLVTDDERIFYPLAAEGDVDMEDWITILNKAIRMEVEETDHGMGTISSFYTRETLRDPSKKIDIRPEMLEHTSTTDAMNARLREKDRHSLFSVYPELLESCSSGEEPGGRQRPAPVPQEKFGFRFLISCKTLSFKLKTERNGNTDHIEPFFLTFALYDVNKGVKISENFHVDLNSAFLRQMVPPPEGLTADGPHPACLKATRATEGVFSVTFPHQDVFLVAKVEKVLQGGITTCAEPYMKDFDNIKAIQKMASQSSTVTTRLGQYRMPFAWAARPLFTTTSELDLKAEFSPLFKQERDKLSDEDFVKMLSNYYTLHKQKLQVIPGELSIEVTPLSRAYRHTANDILTSSYLPLKSPRRGSDQPDGYNSSSPTPPIPMLEVREFAPLEEYHPHKSYHPNTSFTHHLYVYPSSLKYDGQKSFAKARNITCCVQFKEVDEPSAAALPVIYCKSAGAAFTDRATTAVLYHNTNPTFYEEVKIKLPVKLHSSHHLLFTFFHVSCDIQKGKANKSSFKQAPLETPVGYAWLPLMDGNFAKLLGGSHALSVATSLPSGYLSMTPATTNGHSGGTLPRTGGGAASPELKWVDGHKQLFKVVLKFDTTIYALDSQLHHFFMECQRLQSKNSPPPSMAQLLAAIKSLGDMNMTSSVQFLPLVLTQLFKLLSHTSKDVENIKPDVLRLLLSLVDSVVKVEGTDILRSYIEYIFLTEVDSSLKKCVHDELARLLVQYVKQQTQDEDHINKLLDHLWFFLEVMLKSMAQYLIIAKKVAASRKTRYPEDFGWNLQNMVTSILTHIRKKHTLPSAKKANTSLAEFVKRTFSFMDRGVVFKIIARYLDAFSIKENYHLSCLKLEFIRIVCEHEHFVPLNLPFPIASENMEFGLSDEFCRRHFLVGVLLKEVESALEYEASPIRSKTLKTLRNLLAKHDSDTRYVEVGQRGRIASLYFPLIPLILNHVSRLDTGCDSYISPMLNAASMAAFKSNENRNDNNSVFSTSGSVPGSATGTLKAEKDTTLERVKNSNKHTRKPSEMSLEQGELSLSSDMASALLFSAGVGAVGCGLDDVVVEMDKLSVEETRDLLVSLLFVLKHLDTRILHHWWQECMGSSNTSALLFSEEVHTSQFSQLMDFFDVLESCLYAFKYEGHASIARKVQSSKEMEEQQKAQQSAPPTGKDKMGKKASSMSVVSSPLSSVQSVKSRGTGGSVSSPSSSLLSTAIALPLTLSDAAKEQVNMKVRLQGALANEVGLIILTLLDNFSASFKRELSQDEGDNILMTKYFTLMVTFLQVNQSVTLQTHIFALIRSFIAKYREALFRGSADYCGILCYEILQCCNSRLQTTRTEGTILLYLMMRNNFMYFKGKSFVRTNLQATIAVSKLVSTLIGQSDTNLRRSLSAVASYVSQDDKVKNTVFTSEVKDLMDRLKTVLSSTAQMEIHKSDHEKLIDLHYSLAKSYGNSPELRQTWLDSMTALHLKYGNYSEAAQCCIHIAGLVAEYLKIKKIYPAGSKCFVSVSPNVALEETSIKSDQETGDEQTFSERNLVALLETSINYLEQAERYEMMAEVSKLLQPFYEKDRDFKHMMEMYGKLHEAFRKVVDIMTTGKRYLGTYFRVAFFGKPFGEDHDKQFIYKEPKVTTLAELTLRLQKLYSRKFGSKEIVHIIQESGKVNVSSLNPEHAYIQITHVEPYFTSQDLVTRKVKFERENNISRFVYETPFTADGKKNGDVTKQCMRKTILTTSHWFPYVKKRIPVIDQEQFDLTAIQVAIEAIDKKTRDMALVVKMDPPDLKRLQLLLAGSISTQVNQGVQEYVAFFKDTAHLNPEHLDQLREMYRTFMQVCQEALELNGRLISTDQLLYHDDLKSKFQQMEEKLTPYQIIEQARAKSPPLHSDGYALKRRSTRVDPHRMSAILFHSISSSK